MARAIRRNTKAAKQAANRRRLAQTRELAKTKAKRLLMKKGVAGLAGAAVGAGTGVALTKIGVKPLTSAAVLTTAGAVGTATLDGIGHAMALGVAAVGAGQLTLMLFNKVQVRNQATAALPDAFELPQLSSDESPLLDVDIAGEFRNARDAYAEEYADTDDEFEIVLEPS